MHLGAGVPVVLALMVAGVSTVGIVLPSATAAAMDRRGERAGSASAVLGLVQSGSGVVATSAVSLMADGTSRPMVLVMLGCALTAFLLLQGERTRAHEAALRGRAAGALQRLDGAPAQGVIDAT